MSYFVAIVVSLALLGQCQADLIGDICSKSNNPSLCDKVLRGDPRSNGGDARVLAEIALDNAVTATKNSIDVATRVGNDGNKQQIDTCKETFGDAIETLQECKDLIPKTDRFSIGTLQTKGSAALTDVDTCSNDFAGEPNELKQASAEAFTFVQLLLIIVNTF